MNTIVTLIVTFIVIIGFAGFYFSPFPYWKTYFLLWKTLLFVNNKGLNFRARFIQAKFLIHFIILCPIWTFFWFLDEIFYHEYHSKTVRPVFIIGQPRSGTTFLHRTLAADENNFIAIKHIEWRYPYISFHKMLSCFGWAAKIMQKNYWPDNETGKIASKMHPNNLADWEEDGVFFEECFLHHFFIFLRFPYPHLLKLVDEFPQLPEIVQDKILNTHRNVVKKVLFLRGKDSSFFLSKEVTSHNKINKFLTIYPDAKFIVSVRYSTDFMNSLLALVRYSTKSKTGVDPVEIPDWESAFVERMQQHCLMLCELCDHKISQDKQVRIMFDQFIENIIPYTLYIYDKLGLELNVSFQDHLKLINNRQQNRERGYTYEVKSYTGFEHFDAFVEDIRQQLCTISK